MGMERKPWTRDSIGDNMRVRGTDSTEDIATVWDMTDMEDTGHNNQAGILELETIKKSEIELCLEEYLYFVAVDTTVAMMAEMTETIG